MVNFHDPDVIQKDFAFSTHFMHFSDGIYLWEFLTTLRFGWEFITGKRQFKWTFLLYATTRICALGAVITSFVGFNVTHSINCQQWIVWHLIIVYTSLASASVLISLRVIAVWNRNLIVIALTFGMALVNMGFLIYGIATVRSEWSTTSDTCLLENTYKSRDNITVTVSTDIAQLIVMMIGLWRCRRTMTASGIAQYLYVQGLIWLVVATLAEIPSAVFINLNLNGKDIHRANCFSVA
ncbi:hypothetical protein F5148DRAFT_1281023 [Russula earlei]|uniref:Uncharacterized protein n=1 Tax=Russula earlei TaxID=71964 RepID=A0ACC0UJI6_9AGAM|nr:hypothetical protein F5148DRAFT_1281023 [Russula earlei]